jgi:hypothetical protein
MKAYKVIECLEQYDFEEGVLGVFTFDQLKELGAKLVKQRNSLSESVEEFTREENIYNVDRLVTLLIEWDIIATDGYYPRDFYDTLRVVEVEI